MKKHQKRPRSHAAPRYPEDIKRRAREYASQGKILDIRLDTVFKSVFSGKDADSRSALISLLSACIHRKVRDVRIINSEVLPEYFNAKLVRLDVHVVFDGGEAADLEMQMELGDDDIPARAVYNVSRLMSGQGRKGKFYADIKRVYLIFFINAVLFRGSPRVPRRYTLLEETEHERLNDLMELCFYELPKLEAKVRRVLEGKEGVESLSAEEKWCIFFKYRQDEGKEGFIQDLIREEEGLMHAEKVLTKVSKEYEEWAQVLFREKAAMDYRSGMHASYQKGLKEREQQVQAAEQRAQAAEQETQAAKQETQEAKQRIGELERRLREAGLQD